MRFVCLQGPFQTGAGRYSFVPSGHTALIGFPSRRADRPTQLYASGAEVKAPKTRSTTPMRNGMRPTK